MPHGARSSFEVLVDYVQARVAEQDRVVVDARSAGSPRDLHKATRSLVDLKGDLAWARSLLSHEEERGKPFPSYRPSARARHQSSPGRGQTLR